MPIGHFMSGRIVVTWFEAPVEHNVLAFDDDRVACFSLLNVHLRDIGVRNGRPAVGRQQPRPRRPNAA
jgi:hypothetical protein